MSQCMRKRQTTTLLIELTTLCKIWPTLWPQASEERKAVVTNLNLARWPPTLRVARSPMCWSAMGLLSTLLLLRMARLSTTWKNYLMPEIETHLTKGKSLLRRANCLNQPVSLVTRWTTLIWPECSHRMSASSSLVLDRQRTTFRKKTPPNGTQ